VQLLHAAGGEQANKLPDSMDTGELIDQLTVIQRWRGNDN